jgi:hypothetical protein
MPRHVLDPASPRLRQDKRSMFDVQFFVAFSFFACGYAGHALLLPFPF